jgi:hypothetical protein
MCFGQVPTLDTSRIEHPHAMGGSAKRKILVLSKEDSDQDSVRTQKRDPRRRGNKVVRPEMKSGMISLPLHVRPALYDQHTSLRAVSQDTYRSRLEVCTGVDRQAWKM